MLNPWLLLFLPLVAVPIALHLLTLHRLRTVELSTFRFLMDSYIQQRRRLKLLEYLLMILRTAFVALVIFTLSRPVVEHLGFLLGSASGRDVVIALDSGATMALREGGTSSFERGKASAAAIVNLLNADDYVTLVTLGSSPKVIAEGFALNKENLTDQLEELRPSAAGSDVAKLFEHLAHTSKHGPRTIYIISDGQKSNWATLENTPLTAALEETRIVVMDVGPQQPVANAGVVGEPPRALRPIVGLPVLLSATVVNSSPDKPVDTVLTVYLGDQQVTRLNLTLQPGQRVTRPITITPGEAGVIRGRFELPADDFPDDDTFLFCLNVEPNLRVLLVTPPDAPQAADRPALFLRSALESPLKASGLSSDSPKAEPGKPAPAAAAAAAATKEQQIAAALDIRNITLAQLDQAQLDKADVVVLADIALDPPRADLLRKYALSGGGLMILPGPSVKPELYQTLLFQDPRQAAGIGAAFPVRFEEAVGNPDDEAGFQPLAAVALDHPILAAFAEPGQEYFHSVHFFRYFPLRIASSLTDAQKQKSAKDAKTPPVAPPPAGPVLSAGQVAAATAVSNVAAFPLLSLPDRTPMLVESRIGEGKVLLCSFPATPGWTNLPLKPEFVPLLLRSVAYLHRPADAEAPSAVRPQQPATLRITDRWPNAQVSVADPEGKPTTIEMHRSERSMVGALLETDRKGYYNFEVLPRAANAPEQEKLGFAVNLDPRQSAFALLDEQHIRGLLAPADPIYLKGSGDDPALAQQLTHRREIWRTLIWFMFIVIGVEFVLSTLSPRKPLPAGQVAEEMPGGPVRRLAHRLGGLLNRTDLLEQRVR